MYYLIAIYIWLLSGLGVDSQYCAQIDRHPACQDVSEMAPPPPDDNALEYTMGSFISNGF